MKFLFTTRPLVEAVRRMGLDPLLLTDRETIKSILSTDDYYSLVWSLNDACRMAKDSKTLLFNTLANLENITPFQYGNGGCEPISPENEDDFRRGLRGNKYDMASNDIGKMPIVCEVMLLGDKTLAVVLDVHHEEDGLFYSIEKVSALEKALPFDVRLELLKGIGTIFGANDMLASPLMSAHIRSS